MTREMKQIFTRRITQANRTQLIVILYDMTLTYLKDAAAAQEVGCDQEYKKSNAVCQKLHCRIEKQLRFYL